MGPAFPTGDDLRGLGRRAGRAGAAAWADWLAAALAGVEAVGTRPLPEHVAQHLALDRDAGARAGGQWAGRALAEDRRRDGARGDGRAAGARRAHGGALTPADYGDLFGAILAQGRGARGGAGPSADHDLGPLEARVQGANW